MESADTFAEVEIPAQCRLLRLPVHQQQLPQRQIRSPPQHASALKAVQHPGRCALPNEGVKAESVRTVASAAVSFLECCVNNLQAGDDCHEFHHYYDDVKDLFVESLHTGSSTGCFDGPATCQHRANSVTAENSNVKSKTLPSSMANRLIELTTFSTSSRSNPSQALESVSSGPDAIKKQNSAGIPPFHTSHGSTHFPCDTLMQLQLKKLTRGSQLSFQV